MIGKPKCPNYNEILLRNGHGNPPRLVFDQHDDYWLNSPNKYTCKQCELESKGLPEGVTKNTATIHQVKKY